LTIARQSDHEKGLTRASAEGLRNIMITKAYGVEGDVVIHGGGRTEEQRASRVRGMDEAESLK
jgi:hypothetical protein